MHAGVAGDIFDERADGQGGIIELAGGHQLFNVLNALRRAAAQESSGAAWTTGQAQVKARARIVGRSINGK